ncbi:MAG: DUF5680 domain-containing protein [Defluviitaleaceae bacterium]|nr:DUF5680 domain-containing protein [Defluviitaleaceae bacterium]
MDKDLAQFLVRAKQAVFSGKVQKNANSTRPASKDFGYVEDNLKYIDTFIGSAKFAGEEALWRDDAPIWAMNYIGRMLRDDYSVEFIKEAFEFLNQALTLAPEEHPFRGPSEHHDGDYSYKCTIEGDFHWFSGYEEMFYKGEKVYELVFHGGDVEQAG